MTKLFFVSLFTLALTACNPPTSPNDTHTGLCNELKSRIIFNGGTSITRRAEIQSAEEPLLQRNFDKNGC